MINYQLIYNNDTEVIRLPDFASVPIAHPEYVQWLAEGNLPLPADEPTPEELAYPIKVNEAQIGAKGWFTANPNARLLFELSVADLVQANSDHVDAIFPNATAGQRAKEKLWRNAISLIIRVTARRLGLYELI